ncbi:MAG TPA: GDYXXLXY domain-containing protein [Verrucomicrobiae bacterium]|nr:GDYXXLXY domain-containing protein [Verrucomicrobiae bacterium]
MKTSRLLLGCFALMAAAQLAVPAWMIVTHEGTLVAGQLFKFHTAPVDPYDAFRGRYVSVRIEQNSLPIPSGANWTRGQEVFATIVTDTNGFSRLGELRATPPDHSPYVAVRISYLYGQNAYVNVPFDHFYMDETLAPAAEKAYREHSRPSQKNAYITVRIRDGEGVIENLWIDGTPIREFLARK